MWRLGILKFTRPRPRQHTSSPDTVTQPIAPDTPADQSDETGQASQSGQAGLSGLGEITIDLPGPGSLNGPTVRTALREAARLATLSPDARAVPRPALPVVVAVWAAVVGLLTTAVLALLATGTQPGYDGAAWLWLAAHHAPLSTDAGTVTILPMLLLLVPILPLRRAGGFVAAQVPERHVVGFGGIAACCYLVLAAAVALTHRDLPSVPVGWAAWWAGLFAAGAGAWGARRELRGGLRLPAVVRSVLFAVSVPLGIGLVLVAVLVGTNTGHVIGGQQDSAAAGLDHLGLAMLQLAYLPNLVVWAGAFAVGTGFAVGSGTVVSPYSGGQASLPDLPVLSVVPPAAPSWTALLPIAVAVAGAVAAVLFARHAPEPHLGRRIARVLMLAAGAAGTWFVLGVLAGGGIGDGRLAALGPAAGTALLAGVLAAAGGMVWALLPTLASDARPVAADLRTRVATRTRQESAAAGR